MTNELLVHVCLLTAGASLGTGLLSTAAYAVHREDDFYLPYAAVCLSATGFFLALAALYDAGSLAASITALRWHVLATAIVLPSIVWLFARISRRAGSPWEMRILLAGAVVIVVANAFSRASLHFDWIEAATPGGPASAGRVMHYTGHGGWTTVWLHLWPLVPVVLLLLHARHMWRRGERAIGVVGFACTGFFLVANALGTRADFMGGRPPYMGGVPVMFLVILLLGLAMGLARRRQRMALVASRDELRAANESLRDEMARRVRLEARLAESQRMEALGRMAAGVAHDFNNLLTVVTGHAEMVQRRVAPGSPDRLDVDAIAGAAEHGAGLTRQLLAFARQQALAPTALEADGALAGLREMLAQLVGRQTRLELGPGAGGRMILADPMQFTQVIMNLAVNARDAMPDGGRLAIATAWIEHGAPGACACEGALEHGHLLITVEDSGTGMDAETQLRIFEPFFTTKGPEAGTGLGLATVHGIVRQSGGHIEVSSRPGTGTTFRVCWPAAAGAAPGPIAGAPGGVIVTLA